MSVTRKVRINLVSERELLEIPGLDPAGAAAIARFRAEHGPIGDAVQLSSILRGHPGVDAVKESVDFAPADTTAPEAPGA
jgi:helix-hairpin-helix protein